MPDDNDIIARLVAEGVDKFKVDMKEGKGGVDEVDKSVNNFRTSLLNLKNQIITSNIELHKMTEAGQEGTPRFKELTEKVEGLTKKAGMLKLAIQVAQKEITAFGTKTQGLDKFVRGVELGINTVGIFQGAQVLLGKKNEALEKTLVELNAIMIISNSLQRIGAEFARDDSIAKQLAAKATALWNLYMGESVGIMKAVKIAFAGLGIGLVVFAIIELYTNWNKLTQAITGSLESYDEYIKRQEKSGKLGEQKIKDFQTEITYLENIGKLTAESGQILLIQKLKEDQKKAFDEQQKQFKIADDQRKALDADKKAKADGELTQAEMVASIGKGAIVTEKAHQDQVKISQAANLTYEKSVNAVADAEKELAKDRADAAKKLAELLKKEAAGKEKADEAAFKREMDELKKLYDAKVLMANNQEALILEIEKDRAAKEKILIDRQIQVDEKRFANKAELLKREGEEEDRQRLASDKRNAFIADAEQKERDTKIKNQLDVINVIASSGNALFQITKDLSNAKIAILDDELARHVISQKKYDKEVKKIRHDAAVAAKAESIFRITLSTAAAIVGALGSPPYGFAAIAAAAIAGALGAAELAIAAATPIPQFAKGGWVKGKTHAQGGEIIEAQKDEFIVNDKATNFYTKKYGQKFFDDINTMRYDPVLSQNLFGNKDIAAKDYKMYEHLATMSGYIKQGNNIEEKVKTILLDIATSIKSNKGYV